MARFDNYLSSIFGFIDESKRKKQQVRKFSVGLDLRDFARFIEQNYSPKFNSNIVLKSETFLELGNPLTGSCAMTLYTNNTNMLKDCEITLIGPDVGETTEPALPFGQVIMAAGKDLTDNDYYKLCRHVNRSDLIKGYMIKSTQENIWSRISCKAAENGFNFRLLGTAIMGRIKRGFPKVTSVNVLFVTSNTKDVLWLHNMGMEVRNIANTIKEKVWKERGVNILECNRYGHCGLCKDRNVCESIARLATAHRNNHK